VKEVLQLDADGTVKIMAYIQKNNPFKSRKDLRAAKKEAKSMKKDNLTDSEMMGFMTGPSVKEAKKERRQLKKSIRKGTYKPTERTSSFGVMKSTPGQDLSEADRKVRIAKSNKIARKSFKKASKKSTDGLVDLRKIKK